MEGTSFFQIYQDAILHQGHLAAWLCSSFQGRHHGADLLARVIQVSGYTCTAVLTFFIPPPRPLCDQSRPEYITKHILLIKTIVEAHKGKLLIRVPACHFCLCE